MATPALVPSGAFGPFSRRLLWVGTTACAGVIAIASGEGREPAAWLGCGMGLVLAFYATRLPAGIARTTAWGLSLVVASLGAAGGSRGPAACAAIGLFTCVSAAVVANARMPSSGGMVPVTRRAATPWVVVLAVVGWLSIVAFVSPPQRAVAWLVDHADAWGWVALAIGAGVLVGSTERALRRRHLELDVRARGLAARSFLVTWSVACVLATICGPFEAEGAARAGLAVGAAGVALAALHPDAARVARVGRRIVTLSLLGGGLVLAAAGAVSGRADPWFATFVAVAIALGVGSMASRVEAPLRPAGGVWLDAFAQAAREAVRADPEDAIRQALLALRAPLGLDLPSPELWTFAPVRRSIVDAAGYLHERDTELPRDLLEVTGGEPFGTLRTELLEALEVRRPDLRPLRAWMTDRGALVATLVAADGEVDGVLLLPAGRRAEPLALEEVLALKDVALTLAKACRARGTVLRLLARGRDADARAAAAEEAVGRFEQERAVHASRHALVAARLARPAFVGQYAAASRLAVDALEGRTALSAPVVLVGPSGVDPVPYLARAHSVGARKEAPFVVVDGAGAREQDAAAAARWSDPTESPLALADGGMLVLLDAGALPEHAQKLIARAVVERRAPWAAASRKPLDVQLALTCVGAAGLESVGLDAWRDRVDPALRAALAEAFDAVVELPRLADRPEDFRAILTDRLAREGMRTRGRPVGIEPAAYARLTEYEFPGDDVELSAMVHALVASCEKDMVRVADVMRLGPMAPPAADERNGPASQAKRQQKDPLSA
jgi:hypothetical protein